MRHRIITCKNHRNLRWSCKEVAWTDSSGYNGCRNIFFAGVYRDNASPSLLDDAGRLVIECRCSHTDLIIAPEDATAE